MRRFPVKEEGAKSYGTLPQIQRSTPTKIGSDGTALNGKNN